VYSDHLNRKTFCPLLAGASGPGHLEWLPRNLRSWGIYLLGLHLLPSHAHPEDNARWTECRGQIKVTVTLRMLRIDLRHRIENLRVCLLVRRASKELRLRHEFQLRTYTVRQFRRLLGSVPSLEVCNIYDSRYDIEQPFALNERIAYCLFVLRRRLS